MSGYTVENRSDSVTRVWECVTCGCVVATPRVSGFDAHNLAWFIKHPICRKAVGRSVYEALMSDV